MSKKHILVDIILVTLKRELEALTQSALAAHAAATHEESKAEDSHDTRGLEASYLAVAQGTRIEALKKTISTYQFLPIRDFGPNDPIAVGALVELELNGTKSCYFLVSQSGGQTTLLEGKPVQVITPQAPLGEALLGRRLGDTVEVEGKHVSREYEITGVE